MAKILHENMYKNNTFTKGEHEQFTCKSIVYSRHSITAFGHKIDQTNIVV